jgi:hypothetical protein
MSDLHISTAALCALFFFGTALILLVMYNSKQQPSLPKQQTTYRYQIHNLLKSVITVNGDAVSPNTTHHTNDSLVRIEVDGRSYGTAMLSQTTPELYVGGIATKWVGQGFDSMSRPLMAVQGVPWVRIHNLSDMKLCLNTGIEIEPGTYGVYPGRDHRGVRLGTVFHDINNVYPDFIFDAPASDIYYGLITHSKCTGFAVIKISCHSMKI